MADSGGRCLQLFDLRARTHTKITLVGEAPLLAPVGLARGPDRSIFVCDAESGAVYQFSSASGDFLGELPISDVLQRPVALQFDPERQDLLVVDSAAHNIKVFSLDGQVQRIIGRRGAGPGEFNFPLDVIADGETLWVVDTGNHRIQGVTRDGEPVASFGQPGDSPGDLALPKGIAQDGHGNLYVVDARFENVQVFDREGRLLLFFGQEGVGMGEFWLPAGIDIDSNNRIWVCDMYNRRLQVFDYIGAQADNGPEERKAEQPAEEL
ncbi:MAG: 6-bladed beta-propeller [Planctomycetota bacterium]